MILREQNRRIELQPLLYLTARTVLNGIKRALTSGRRLIGLVFVLGYWILVFIRPFERDTRASRGDVPQIPPSMIPQLQQVEAFAFVVFALISFGLSLSMFAPRTGFKQADVDVLFPTPVNPAKVLLFQMVRNYLATLLLPLLLVLFGYRGAARGVQTFSDQYPTMAPAVFRSGFLAYLLLALFFVVFTTAVSLRLNRTEENSDRIRKRAGWSYGLLYATVIAVVAGTSVQAGSLDHFIQTVLSIPIRILFLPATFATMLVTGAASGNGLVAAAGGLALVAGMVVSFRACMAQAGWMYDQAATATALTANTMELQKKGDFTGMIAEQARLGKVKGAKDKWYHRIRTSGAPALAWKEFILQLRSTLALNVIMSVLAMALPIMMVALPGRGERALSAIGPLYLGMLAFGMFFYVLSTAQIGFFEVLRRVDLQKPLPFSPATVVFWEIAAKGILAFVPLILTSIVALILKPMIWAYILAGIIVIPSMTILLYSATFLTIVLFPDIDDPTQRGFRGLMQMLGIVIVSFPGVAIVAGGLLAGNYMGVAFAAPYILALVATLVNSVLVGILATVSGNLYASYNPSE